MTTDAFDAAIDTATISVLEAFVLHGANLPAGDALALVMIDLNGAIARVMREALGQEAAQ